MGADWIRFIPLNYSHSFGYTDYFDSRFLDNDNDNIESNIPSFLAQNSGASDNFDYSMTKIDIGTAGSIANVLLTIIPPISISGIDHDIQIIGGTDVKYGPTIDYLRYIVREVYASIGINFSIDILKRGYYPKGGGIVNTEIKAINLPAWKSSISLSRLLSAQPNNLNDAIINNNSHNAARIRESAKKESIVASTTTSIIRAPQPQLMKIKIVSVCSQLPKHVAERQLSAAISNLTKNDVDLVLNANAYAMTTNGYCGYYSNSHVRIYRT